MNTRLVFKVSIARKLLKMNYRMVDIRPSKDKDGNTDFSKSVYVFADENNITEEIKKLVGQNSSRH